MGMLGRQFSEGMSFFWEDSSQKGHLISTPGRSENAPATS